MIYQNLSKFIFPLLALSSCSGTGLFGITQKNKSEGLTSAESTPQVIGTEHKPSSDALPQTQPPPETQAPVSSVVEHEAVFAVRNMNCALCHAKIESTVITNFAQGTGDKAEAQALAGFFHTTNNSKVTYIGGDFIVPEFKISSLAAGVADGESTCLNKYSFASTEDIVTVDLLRSIRKCAEHVLNWGPTSKKFVGVKAVEINPPSDPEKIRILANAENLTQHGYDLLGAAQFSPVSDSNDAGFQFSGPIECEGAVVFDAPVVFKNAKISSQLGCRIYSTRSIFVFGTLEVLGGDSANLQLLSSSYIGFDISISNVEGRLLHGALNHQRFSHGTPSDMLNLIKADAVLAKISSLAGAGSANYSRVAATAPVVYSRSSGSFSGVIIAEQFIGRIGSLAFTFDPVFSHADTKTSFYPEIKTPLTHIE